MGMPSSVFSHSQSVYRFLSSFVTVRLRCKNAWISSYEWEKRRKTFCLYQRLNSTDFPYIVFPVSRGVIFFLKTKPFRYNNNHFYIHQHKHLILTLLLLMLLLVLLLLLIPIIIALIIINNIIIIDITVSRNLSVFEKEKWN